MEVWPPGSLDINPFDCVRYLGEVLTDTLTEKTVPDHHYHGDLQQHPQGGHQEGLQPLPVQAREGRFS
jgi:hypothetical protein